MASMLRRMLCALIALLTLAAPAAMATSMDAYIGWNTKIYLSASTSSASMSVPKGLSVDVISINGSWAKIRRDGVNAFIPLKYIVLENRVKGYLNKSVCLYSSPSTSSGKIGPMPVNTEIYIIGFDGSYYRVQSADGSVTCYVQQKYVSGSKTKVKEPAPEAKPVDPMQNVVMMDWFDGGSSVMKRGTYATIYDIKSGQTIRIKRMGGSNHADIEPATAEDTAKLLAACGGEFSWDSRPVILMAGDTYVACAINTMPHGDQTIFDNDYEGQCCLHMVNSITHGSQKVNEAHQKAILEAYNWAHSR